MALKEQLLGAARLPRRLLRLVVLHYDPPAASPYPSPHWREKRQLLRYRLLQWQQHTQQQLLRPWPPRLFPFPSGAVAAGAAAEGNGRQQQQKRKEEEEEERRLQQARMEVREEEEVNRRFVEEETGAAPAAAAAVSWMRGEARNVQRAAAARGKAAAAGADGGEAATKGGEAAAKREEATAGSVRSGDGEGAETAHVGAEEGREQEMNSRIGSGRRRWRPPQLSKNAEEASARYRESDSSSCRQSSSSSSCTRESSSSEENSRESVGSSSSSLAWRNVPNGESPSGRTNGGGARRGRARINVGARSAAADFFSCTSSTEQQPQFFISSFSFVPSHWKPPSLWPAHYALPPAPPPPAAVGSRETTYVVPLPHSASAFAKAASSSSSPSSSSSEKDGPSSSSAAASSFPFPRCPSPSPLPVASTPSLCAASSPAAAGAGAALKHPPPPSLRRSAAAAVSAAAATPLTATCATAAEDSAGAGTAFHAPPSLAAEDDACALRVHAVGHGTFLLQCCGVNVLTDPILSSHAGPFGCIGVPRVSQPAVSLEDLPPIDAILISSLRYDSYDYSTIRKLCRRDGSALFIPQGGYSRRYFSPKVYGSVYAMKWGDRVQYDNMTVCFTPAIHAAVGRYVWDYGVTACGGFILQLASLSNPVTTNERGQNLPQNSHYGTNYFRDDLCATKQVDTLSPGVYTHAEMFASQPQGSRGPREYGREKEEEEKKKKKEGKGNRKPQHCIAGRQKTVYYAGRTAYSRRLFDLVREAAVRDRQRVAFQREEEAVWREQSRREHDEYLRRLEELQQNEEEEELLLLPSSALFASSVTVAGKELEKTRQQPPQQQQQGSVLQQTHVEDRDMQSTAIELRAEEKFAVDLAILPIGGYEPQPYMQRYQMTPEEAVEAHLRLRSRVTVASHFDVFPIGSESFEEAPQRLHAYCKEKSISTSCDPLHQTVAAAPSARKRPVHSRDVETVGGHATRSGSSSLRSISSDLNNSNSRMGCESSRRSCTPPEARAAACEWETREGVASAEEKKGNGGSPQRFREEEEQQLHIAAASMTACKTEAALLHLEGRGLQTDSTAHPEEGREREIPRQKYDDDKGTVLALQPGEYAWII